MKFGNVLGQALVSYGKQVQGSIDWVVWTKPWVGHSKLWPELQNSVKKYEGFG